MEASGFSSLADPSHDVMSCLQFTVVSAANLPPKPVLAVHAGDVRRQIKLEAGCV